jgi:hypothetical protein
VSISESSPAVAAAQPLLAGTLDVVSAAGRGWLAAPGGRHAEHAGAAPTVSLCVAVGQGGEPFAERLAELRVLADADAQLVVVVAAEASDWTYARSLRAACDDRRVVVYQGAAGLTHDQLVVAALALSAAPLALLVPAGARLAVDVLAILGAALERAPAAVAAVAASVDQRPGRALAVLEPWCGTAYLSGPQAATTAIAAPAADLAARPALIRTAALQGGRGSSLRDVLLGLAARGDVVGLAQPLAVLAAPVDDDADVLRESVAAAIRTADLVGRELAERPVVDAAARSLATAVAAVPLDPVALAGAGAALQRLAHAVRGPATTDLQVLVPGAPPLPLELRELPFLCRFAWDGPPDGLEALVGAYVATFAPSDPVSLVLCAETAGAPAVAAETWLVELLTGALGRSLDAIPDIVMESGAVAGETLSALHAAVGWVVALPGDDRRIVLEAMACGVPVIGAPNGLVSASTGLPVGAAGLGPALAAAAATDESERARRGGLARLQMLAQASPNAAICASVTSRTSSPSR